MTAVALERRKRRRWPPGLLCRRKAVDRQERASARGGNGYAVSQAKRRRRRRRRGGEAERRREGEERGGEEGQRLCRRHCDCGRWAMALELENAAQALTQKTRGAENEEEGAREKREKNAVRASRLLLRLCSRHSLPFLSFLQRASGASASIVPPEASPAETLSTDLRWRRRRAGGRAGPPQGARCGPPLRRRCGQPCASARTPWLELHHAHS